MSWSAILACFMVYSALYCIYFFFAHSNNALLMVVAIALLIFAAKISPYAYEQRSKRFNQTLMWGDYWYWPLITWWRLFILPAKWLLSFLSD